MKKSTRVPESLTQGTNNLHTGVAISTHGGASTVATEGAPPVNSDTPASAHTDEAELPRKVTRGLTTTISSTKLKQAIWLRALLTANRFRVIRTLDVSVCCCAERPFKAALTAAQRAVRGMVKAELLKRYRSDRFQTIYGLTQKGASWLDEAGYEASSSVRRVSDMTNPEHRLWAQFWTLACEARGLNAMTEQELLQHLNQGKKPEEQLIQGLLNVVTTQGSKTRSIQLRPDAVATENGSTIWLEVDRSKRGSDREASLNALASSVGRKLKDGSRLRRVVIFCKTERIRKRALAIVNGLASANNAQLLLSGRRHYREVEPGIYAIWTALESKLSDGRSELVDTLVGYINIQMLPIWLPKVRIDASNTHSLAGWFDENYLPYRRAPEEEPWPKISSPLLTPVKPTT